MTFTIDQVYKQGVPRGQTWESAYNTLTAGSYSSSTFSPSTSPENWTIMVSKMKFKETSFVTGGTGSGYFEMTYPDYSGSTTTTVTYDSLNHLKLRADEVVNSETTVYNFEIKFDPPIRLNASSDVNTFTAGLPTDVTAASGTFEYMFTGWQLKESDYD